MNNFLVIMVDNIFRLFIIAIFIAFICTIAALTFVIVYLLIKCVVLDNRKYNIIVFNHKNKEKRNKELKE